MKCCPSCALFLHQRTDKIPAVFVILLVGIFTDLTANALSELYRSISVRLIQKIQEEREGIT